MAISFISFISLVTTLAVPFIRLIIIPVIISGMSFLPLCILRMIPVFKVFFFLAVTDRRLIMFAFIVGIFLSVLCMLQVWFVYTVEHYFMTVVYVVTAITCRQL